MYATELKTALAGVPAELLAAHGPVSPETAAALADGVRERCGADWGIGLTGVAGPDPVDGHEPGRVYLGIADGRHRGRRAGPARGPGRDPAARSPRRWRGCSTGWIWADAGTPGRVDGVTP